LGKPLVIGVSIAAGKIAFTVIPFLFDSFASVFVKARSAPLAED
jgi:hypothetical protein